jgi:DNA-binding transcriptional ArsR family regulator
MSTRLRILKLLAERGEAMTPIRIARGLKMDHATVRQTLRRMVYAGEIHGEFGRYCHSDTTSGKESVEQYANAAMRGAIYKLDREHIDAKTISWAAMFQGAEFMRAKAGEGPAEALMLELPGMFLSPESPEMRLWQARYRRETAEMIQKSTGRPGREENEQPQHNGNVAAAKDLPNYPGLAEKLDPLLEAIFDRSTRHPAKLSLHSIQHAVVMLERRLVEAGIMPGSRRSNDAIAYARQLRTEDEKATAKAFEGASQIHREKLARREEQQQLRQNPDLDAWRSELKELLAKAENRADAPENVRIGLLYTEAQRVIYDKVGDKPADTWQADQWKRKRNDAWRKWCGTVAPGGAHTAKAYMKDAHDALTRNYVA